MKQIARELKYGGIWSKDFLNWKVNRIQTGKKHNWSGRLQGTNYARKLIPIK